MAIYKISTSRASSHAALMGVLRYVLNEDKTPSKLVAVSGHYNSEEITAEDVYAHFIRDKKLWNKDSGRMYTHCIVSFPPNERITLRGAKEFGEEFAAKAFPGHQALIVVHEDKCHLHCHIVLNSVNYHNGSKLHCTRKDLEQQRTICNDLCRQHGYSVPEKGKHIDGGDFDEHDFVVWNKKKYQIIKKAATHSREKIDILKLIVLILKAMLYSHSLLGFFRYMENHGWKCYEPAHSKHITFESKEPSRKFRASNVQKTFHALFSQFFGDEFILNKKAIQNIVRLSDEQREKLLLPVLEVMEQCIKPHSGYLTIAPFDPVKWREERGDRKKEKQYPFNGKEQ